MHGPFNPLGVFLANKDARPNINALCDKLRDAIDNHLCCEGSRIDPKLALSLYDFMYEETDELYLMISEDLRARFLIPYPGGD